MEHMQNIAINRAIFPKVSTLKFERKTLGNIPLNIVSTMSENIVFYRFLRTGTLR